MTTQRVGREKRHFLNPVPIRLVHDRWTGKFAEPIVGSLSTIKVQLETPMDRIDHVYSIYIKAAARARLARDHRRRRHAPLLLRHARRSDWTPGSALTYAYPDGSVAADGEVLEIDPGRSVAMSFHPRWSPEIEAEGPVRMIWLVEPTEDGGSRLTVTSALIPGSKTRSRVRGRRRLHRLRASRRSSRRGSRSPSERRTNWPAGRRSTARRATPSTVDRPSPRRSRPPVRANLR